MAARIKLRASSEEIILFPFILQLEFHLSLPNVPAHFVPVRKEISLSKLYFVLDVEL